MPQAAKKKGQGDGEAARHAPNAKPFGTLPSRRRLSRHKAKQRSAMNYEATKEDARKFTEYNLSYGGDGFQLMADFAKAVNESTPIDMILHCPNCGLQHVDKTEPDMCECKHAFDEHGPEPHGIHDHSHCRADMHQCECREFKIAWLNPPHRSHLCHGCKNIWRPADVPTNGVSAIKTCGGYDTRKDWSEL